MRFHYCKSPKRQAWALSFGAVKPKTGWAMMELGSLSLCITFGRKS